MQLDGAPPELLPKLIPEHARQQTGLGLLYSTDSQNQM